MSKLDDLITENQASIANSVEATTDHFDPQLQPYMLILTKQTGDCVALSYTYLVKIEFNLSKGITLHFTDTKIILEGRNLEPIFEDLTRHQCKPLWEITEQYDDRPAEDTVINKISIEDITF